MGEAVGARFRFGRVAGRESFRCFFIVCRLGRRYVIGCWGVCWI